MVVGNDHSGQELGAKRSQSDMHNTVSVTVLQTTGLKGKREPGDIVGAKWTLVNEPLPEHCMTESHGQLFIS